MTLDEPTLREAAFELVASSTSRRYIREATRLAREGGLAEAVQNDAAKRTAAEARASELLRRLQGETERSPAEVEVAVLLCALAWAGASDVIRQGAASPSVWISGLAAWLRDHGPTSDVRSLIQGDLLEAQRR